MTALFSDLEGLRSFQNQIAAIQRDAVWWLHTVVPTISKVGAKDYVHWSVTVSILRVSYSNSGLLFAIFTLALKIIVCYIFDCFLSFVFVFCTF